MEVWMWDRWVPMDARYVEACANNMTPELWHEMPPFGIVVPSGWCMLLMMAGF